MLFAATAAFKSFFPCTTQCNRYPESHPTASVAVESILQTDAAFVHCVRLPLENQKMASVMEVRATMTGVMERVWLRMTVTSLISQRFVEGERRRLLSMPKKPRVSSS